MMENNSVNQPEIEGSNKIHTGLVEQLSTEKPASTYRSNNDNQRHVVDASKIVPIKAPDLIKVKGKPSNSEATQITELNLDVPSLVMVYDLDLIEEEQADECCKILSGIVKSHPESLFLFNEMHTERLTSDYGLKLPANVSKGNVVKHIVEGNALLNLFPPHWVMITEPVHFTDYKSLSHFTWVIVKGSDGEKTTEELLSIAKIVTYCNSLNKCISTIPYIRLDVLKTALQEGVLQ